MRGKTNEKKRKGRTEQNIDIQKGYIKIEIDKK